MKPTALGKGCHDHPKDGSRPQCAEGRRGIAKKKSAGARQMPARAPKPNGKPTGPYVPQQWRESYDRARNDPEAQGTFVHDISLLRSMQDELTRMLETDESPAAWRVLKAHGEKLRREMAKLQEHVAAGRTDKANDANRRILALLAEELLPTIDGGVGAESTRRELRQTTARLEGIQKTWAKMQRVLNEVTYSAGISRIMILIDQAMLPICQKYPEVKEAYERALLQAAADLTFDPADEMRRISLPRQVESGNGQVIETAAEP